jgi:hypothetical protein
LNPDLQQELLAMISEDDNLREQLAADGSLFEGYHPHMEHLHQKNTARLKSIIAVHGWPGSDLAGEEGEEAAWRIAQHSISDPAFMRTVLKLLQSACENQNAPPWQVAMMEDRIRMFEGRMQLYGTSFDWDDSGVMNPYPPIEEKESVDERRSAMGLSPLEEEIARHRATNESPPANLKERRRQMEEWARKTGWRNF